MATQQSVAIKVDRAALPPFDRATCSPAEWQIRVDLAATYRLVALYGWDDMVFTHISARVPGPEHHFLINPYGMTFDEITASSLVKIDLEGRPQHATPHYVNAAGFTIHSAMHMHSENANCVIHTHSDDGVAVAAQKHGILPISQTAMIMWGDIAYHDYEGVALDLGERERLLADMGDKHCMVLRNHGLLTVGKNCADAFLRLYYLERACTYQVKALSAGIENLNMPHQGTPEHTAEMVQWSFDGGAGKLSWPALLRKLDRVNPGYDA
jgi:ribulose-5-phosphate 4-epimerase/fuculose-1-phosphate aldolase